MQFDSWGQFIGMNGYGFFVWLSFGISALAVLLCIVISRYNRREIIRSIMQAQLRKERILQAEQDKNQSESVIRKSSI
ncbi:heme exporter protein CcmD [Neptunicella sp.]|uniref:heme exporter protein CcmD n=1 Tax=Neptunicella sp. TaxID=2125986 RepID=UPI003F6901BE